MSMGSREEFYTRSERQFSKWAAVYDGFLFRIYFEPLYREIIKTIKKNAEPKLSEGIQVLDVACGTAEVISRLAAKFPKSQFIGLDFSQGMVQKAQEKIKNASNIIVRQAEAEDISFPENTFDSVICSEAFHHFFDPQNALKEMKRVLKTNGKLLLVDLDNMGIFIRLFGKIFKRIERARKYYSQKEMRSLLTQSGFSVQDIFTRHWNNFFICVKI